MDSEKACKPPGMGRFDRSQLSSGCHGHQRGGAARNRSASEGPQEERLGSRIVVVLEERDQQISKRRGLGRSENAAATQRQQHERFRRQPSSPLFRQQSTSKWLLAWRTSTFTKSSPGSARSQMVHQAQGGSQRLSAHNTALDGSGPGSQRLRQQLSQQSELSSRRHSTAIGAVCATCVFRVDATDPDGHSTNQQSSGSNLSVTARLLPSWHLHQPQ